MVMILPLIIFILLIGVLIMVYRMTTVSGRRLFTNSTVYFMLGGYVVLLLISVIMFKINPYPETTLPGKEVDPEKMPINYGIPYDVIEEGIPIENFAAYKEEEWEFELTGNELKIQSSEHDSLEASILIEEKEEADSLVEVMVYSTPTLIDHLDISDALKPTRILFQEGNRLEINQPHDEVNTAVFSKEFVFNQFSKDESSEFEMASGPTIQLRDIFLYIRIPHGVKIDAYDYLWIEYVK